MKKGVLKCFAKLTGKHLHQSIFFNKVAGLRLIKKEILAQAFPVNFAKFLRTPSLQNTSGRLLLYSSPTVIFHTLLFQINCQRLH